MKRDLLALSGLILLAGFLASCGGGSTANPTTPQTSGLTKRVFADNSYSGRLNIIDASMDVFSNHLISVSGSPRQMALALDRSVTVDFNATTNQINVIPNAAEAPSGAVSLPGVAYGLVALSNATGFAAVRNSNAVEVLDLTNFVVTGAVTVENPQQMVLSNDGKKLLVFSDTLPGSITVIDTATATTSPSTAATTVSSASFDHPVSAVFSSDNTKAYILSCGLECGGTTANVTVVDMTTSPPTPGATVAVPGGATVGLLSSSTLYLAGNTDSTPGNGELTIVDTGAMTASAPVAIGDGYHRAMALDTHGHVYIGATTCTQLRCLTTYDTTSKTATVEVDPDPTHNGNGFGDVTGHIQPISGRDRVYLAQGGEIRIFDSTTAQALPLSQQLDAVGYIWDLLQVDP